MPEAGSADGAFAISNDAQYRPVPVLADQHLLVSDAGRDQGSGLLLCHSSLPLHAPRRQAGPLVVVVHGALRDSDRYLVQAQAAARRAGSDALVVAPQFLSDVDTGTPDGVLRWEVEGWKGGYPALGPAALSSFAAMDSLLDQLTRSAGPGHRLRVVIFGNSAGGQFVNRYAAVGRGPRALARRGVHVRFVIANPSTYLYFDGGRPVTVQNGSSVNRWRYGFEDAPAYVRTSPWESLERYLGRDVAIVLGTQDNDGAAPLLEVGPPALAQGANRFERGINYDRHVRRLARARGLTMNHQLVRLPGVGHAVEEVLAAPQLQQIMFG
jgi:pimeloyl-ACP methyl ester carboxylesterase